MQRKEHQAVELETARQGAGDVDGVVRSLVKDLARDLVVYVDEVFADAAPDRDIVLVLGQDGSAAAAGERGGEIAFVHGEAVLVVHRPFAVAVEVHLRGVQHRDHAVEGPGVVVDVLIGIGEVEVVEDVLVEHRDGVALEVAEVQIPEEGVDRVPDGDGVDGLPVPPGIVEGQGVDGEDVDVAAGERVVDDEIQIAGVEIIRVFPGGHDFFDGGVGVGVFPLFQLEGEVQRVLDGLVAVEDRVVEGFAGQSLLADVGVGEVRDVIEDAEAVAAEIFDGQGILGLRGLGLFLGHGDGGGGISSSLGRFVAVFRAFATREEREHNEGQGEEERNLSFHGSVSR